MKKFIIFIIFLLCFIAGIEGENSQPAILIFEGRFSLYGVGYSEVESEKIDCGSGLILSVKSDDAEQLFNAFKGEVYGMSVELNKEMELEEILKIIKAKIVKKESVAGREIYYCYSNNNSDYVIDNGQKINYQIAINNGNIIIGTPLILGSY